MRRCALWLAAESTRTGATPHEEYARFFVESMSLAVSELVYRFEVQASG